jgi:carboxypeptidase family protein
VSPKVLVAVLAAIFLVGPAAAVADAQVTSAAVVGTVTDASGAALPGVTVTARNVETGFVRSVPTNESGAYRLDFLPTGTRDPGCGIRDPGPSGIRDPAQRTCAM